MGTNLEIVSMALENTHRINLRTDAEVYQFFSPDAPGTRQFKSRLERHLKE